MRVKCRSKYEKHLFNKITCQRFFFPSVQCGHRFALPSFLSLNSSLLRPLQHGEGSLAFCTSQPYTIQPPSFSPVRVGHRLFSTFVLSLRFFRSPHSLNSRSPIRIHSIIIISSIMPRLCIIFTLFIFINYFFFFSLKTIVLRNIYIYKRN